ncbi:hypothetical protein FXO37_10735 [Capsicum annuum]|nr:hypothetical protein FXO37_10735 [Capsicum annuum]
MDAQKQYYRIHGMPPAMQVWFYEFCSAVDPKIAVKYDHISVSKGSKRSLSPVAKHQAKKVMTQKTVPRRTLPKQPSIPEKRKSFVKPPVKSKSSNVPTDGPNVKATTDKSTVPQSSSQDINAARFSVSNQFDTSTILEENSHQMHTSDEQVIEDDGVATLRPETESQYEIPDELLPSLNLHINVIFYYLRKKDKYSPPSNYTYTTVDCVFKIKVAELWEKLMTGVPWHTVDHVLIPLHVKEQFYWVLVVVSFLDWCLYVYDSYNSTIHNVYVKTEVQKFTEVIPSFLLNIDFYKKKINIDWQCHPKYRNRDESDSFEVIFVNDIPQQISGSMDCGIYVATYAEFLTGGQGVPNQEFDIALLYIRYATLL